MTQNYAICYHQQDKIEFGLIKKFFQVEIDDRSIFCVVQKLSKKTEFSEDVEIENYLDKFFLIANIEESYSFIHINQILNKCTILKNAGLNEIFVSRCSELKEHN
jgi:hypothetical protein